MKLRLRAKPEHDPARLVLILFISSAPNRPLGEPSVAVRQGGRVYDVISRAYSIDCTVVRLKAFGDPISS